MQRQSQSRTLWTKLGIAWWFRVVMFGVRMDCVLYTCLKTAVVSHEPLKNIFSIYSYSDRFDLIDLGWG